MITLNDINHRELKSHCRYDSRTGIFYRRKDSPTTDSKAGDPMGTICQTHNYVIISINNRTYKAHRLAYLYKKGYFPENEIDHRDRIKYHNAWKNLQESSRSCNNRNKGLSIANKSGVIGVRDISQHRKVIGHNRWEALITPNGKQIFLGLFSSLYLAAKARWEAEVRFDYPRCNTTSSAYLYIKNHKGEG